MKTCFTIKICVLLKKEQGKRQWPKSHSSTDSRFFSRERTEYRKDFIKFPFLSITVLKKVISSFRFSEETTSRISSCSGDCFGASYQSLMVCKCLAMFAGQDKNPEKTNNCLSDNPPGLAKNCNFLKQSLANSINPAVNRVISGWNRIIRSSLGFKFWRANVILESNRLLSLISPFPRQSKEDVALTNRVKGWDGRVSGESTWEMFNSLMCSSFKKFQSSGRQQSKECSGAAVLFNSNNDLIVLDKQTQRFCCCCSR